MLKPLNGTAQRRLGHMKPAGGPAEMQFLRHGKEGPDLMYFHSRAQLLPG